MEPKSTFDADLAESEEAFAEQFDKASITFHAGDPTPVPIGGSRVPDSMPTMYLEEVEPKQKEVSKEVNIIEEIKDNKENPDTSDPAKTQDKPKDKNYEENVKKLDELTARRVFLSEIKVTLNAVCPPIETILRIKTKGLPKDKEEAQIKEEYGKLKVIVDQLNVQNELLLQTEFKDRYCAAINIICKNAFIDFKGKEDYGDFHLSVKKYTSMCFQDMTKLLDEIKKVKKLLA